MSDSPCVTSDEDGNDAQSRGKRSASVLVTSGEDDLEQPEMKKPDKRPARKRPAVQSVMKRPSASTPDGPDADDRQRNEAKPQELSSGKVSLTLITIPVLGLRMQRTCATLD